MLDSATVCSAKLPVQEAVILALSADQLLLACVSAATVRVFSLPHLLNHQTDLPAHTLQMEQPLLQFSWCPDAADSTQFLALTAGRVLLHGSLAHGSATLAEHVECASWAPDGQHVAYTSGSKLVVMGVDGKDSAFKVDLPPPEGEGAFGAAGSIAAAARLVSPCNAELSSSCSGSGALGLSACLLAGVALWKGNWAWHADTDRHKPAPACFTLKLSCTLKFDLLLQYMPRFCVRYCCHHAYIFCMLCRWRWPLSH